MSQVCAVVLTHNRKDLLKECLLALQAQTRPPEAILVVDNASTDGTQEMLAQEFPGVWTHRLLENLGAAGGFREGLRLAHAQGYEWLWILDDDVIPQPQALDELLQGIKRVQKGLGKTPIVAASRVLWKDGSLHLINIPFMGDIWLRLDKIQRLPDLVSLGLLQIRSATYTSILVHREGISRYGLPYKDYFLWGDDVEFTARLLRNPEELGIFVPQSIVIHKSMLKASPAEVKGPAIGRFFYEVRNKIWMAKSRAFDPIEKVAVILSMLLNVALFLGRNPLNLEAHKAVLWGLVKGLLESPKE